MPLKEDINNLIDEYIYEVNNNFKNIKFSRNEEYDRKIAMMSAIEKMTLERVIKHLLEILKNY
ncbi:MAG: hypothetical protein GF383_16785 [Candidatus Lokiarchaeota archaeon]|nr:hypothetical protein [Candidatus Lokiarchaeota archaeon]